MGIKRYERVYNIVNTITHCLCSFASRYYSYECVLVTPKANFFTLSKRLELLAPQYFIVLSAIFLQEYIVMAVGQFSFSWAVLEMIAVWIMLVAIGMKGHKLYKRLDKKTSKHKNYINSLP